MFLKKEHSFYNKQKTFEKIIIALLWSGYFNVQYETYIIIASNFIIAERKFYHYRNLYLYHCRKEVAFSLEQPGFPGRAGRVATPENSFSDSAICACRNDLFVGHPISFICQRQDKHYLH